MNRRRGPLPLDEIRRRLIPHQRTRRPSSFEFWSLATISDEDVLVEPARPSLPPTRRFALV